MNRFWSVTAVCMLVASSSPALPDPGPTFNESIIARVDCLSADGEGVGTAWRIADGRYVTAGHVAKMGGACTVGGQPMTIEMLDNVHDIAVVDTPKTGGPVAKLNCSDFKPDTDYVAIGYAFGYTTLTVEPLTASPLEVDGYRAMVGEVIPGMSGGPVFGYDGKVYGIVNMRWASRSMSLAHTFVCRN